MSVFCQNPTYQQKLFYTCKVWGFVKYYHSEVSTCQVNWDSVLIATLPLVKNAVTGADFNNIIDTMLLAAGPMEIAITPPLAPLPPELCRNLNFGWIHDTILRNDVQIILDTLKNNFRPHNICWVEDNDYTTPYIGWLVIHQDSLIYGSDTYSNFPDEWHRLHMLFVYWNIITYFNPYNYVLDNPVDSTLNNYVLSFANVGTSDSLFLCINKICTELNDVHAEGLTTCSNIPVGGASPLLIVRHVEGKYIASKSSLPNIALGDQITAVDGVTTAQWEDSLSPLVSAGDSAVFRRIMCSVLLNGAINSQIVIESIDSMGNAHVTNTTRSFYTYISWFSSHYFNDTLYNKKWRLWDCNVGYVNMGKLLSTDVNPMYLNLQNTTAIIFDLRNYPNGTGWDIANLMYPQQLQFANNATPDVTYPGTFYWGPAYGGINNNPNSYSGQVIVLVNEFTQSQAEYTCMILEAMPNAVIVGSQTAGADGNVTYFNMSSDIQVGYTSLGIFYPNGDSTQRIGIVPDSVVYRTQEGIRDHRDELLEKALQIAGCPSTVPEIPTNASLNISPNPTLTNLHIISLLPSEFSEIKVLDITGQTVISKIVPSQDGFSTTIDLTLLPAGIYLIQVSTKNKIQTQKFIKQ